MNGEAATVKVLMSPELMERWLSRDSDGRLLTWSWGEPDADGFYTPTITSHDDDRLGELDRAWAEAEAALPEGCEDLSLEAHFNGCFAHMLPDATGASDDPIGVGPTPAAALQALTAKLRERVS